MDDLLSIGDFARATHLSIKALRHYQQHELLAPAQIDAASGYRRYRLDQIPTAQIIRRFRSLDMPLDDIREILATDDIDQRNTLIARHLRRLERELASTRDAVASLRDLLETPKLAAPIEHRRLPARTVAAIQSDVATAEISAWYHGALGELYATFDHQGADLTGTAGGVYADGIFADEHGDATVYLPVAGALTETGRIRIIELPAVELAVIAHDGPDVGIDREYGALAEYVTQHALAVEGQIHEFYPVNRHHGADPSGWRTEIGWPIFAVGG